MKVRTVSASCAAVVLTVALTGSAMAYDLPVEESQQRLSSEVSDTEASTAVPSAAVASVYGLLVENLFDPDPDAWGDAYVDGDLLVVNSKEYSVEEAERLIHGLGVDMDGVTIKSVDFSIAELEAAVDAVSVAVDGFSEVVSVGPEFSEGQVVIGVEGRSAARSGASPADEVLEAAEGQVLGGIEVSTFETARPETTSRFYDTSPYYGGAAIIMTGGGAAGHCSAAFAWNSPSAGQYMVTASHCYKVPGSTTSTVNRVLPGGTPSPIGSVVYSSGGANGTSSGRSGDFAVYKLSSGITHGRIFKNAGNTTTSTIVQGFSTLPQGWSGSSLRTSGAARLGQTGPGVFAPDRISLVGQTVTYSNGQRFTGMTVAEHSSTCVTPGDSGGAVYEQSGTGVYAVGVISGTDNGGAGLSNCKSFYTPVRSIVNHYGGTVKRG